jgi:ubiquinone/menaquinone biosynthesis C-methylase UbiE
MTNQSESELDVFRSFERAAHDTRAKTYYDAFSAVTNRAIEPLLDAAQVREGTKLLDVASGPGTLAGRAAQRSAIVVGTDIAPSMVALARELHPALTFREASAEDLPFAPSSFDCVVSGFGIGHFSAPGRALAEFARVLAPKGRVALSWWDGFEKNRINGIFFDVISELGINASDALPAGPSVGQFSDPDKFAETLRAAGSRSRGLSTYLFRIRCQVSTNYGTWRWVALCAYLQLFKPRTLMFSKAFAKWSIKQHNNTFRPRAWIFPLRLELLQECASWASQPPAPLL